VSRNGFRILVVKQKERVYHEENIKMDFREIGWGGVD
jgi:hypothetical protein